MLTTPSAPRIRDVQVAEIGINTTIFRSRTWDRLKFEIEYAQQKGTTANSYLIKGEKLALIDPPGESFTQIFVCELENQVDLSQLDYIILGHVNPNRMATLKVILAKAPQVTLVCSKPAANAIKNVFPQWEKQIMVIRSECELDLGQGHRLQLITAPTPRWPDGMLTFDPLNRILYTDKFFGVHLCSDDIWDEEPRKFDDDRRYYFDCLHGAQSKQVEDVLNKLTPFKVKYYAPNHGPIVRYSLSRLTYDYRYWCQEQRTKTLTVALLYASAYGNTATLAQAIAQGLIEQNVKVESINCEQTDPEEIAQVIEASDGFVIGSPTLGGHAPVQIQTALGIILASATKTKLAGVFGSYGWSGEAIDLMENKLKDGNFRFGFDSIRVRFSPDEEDLNTCYQAGVQFAQILKKSQKSRVPRQGLMEAQSDRTEQAVGRIIGSLCVVSTPHGSFLTSRVSQASFSPPGIMITIQEEQNADSIMTIGNVFLLNILKEGRSIRKHFSSVCNPDSNSPTEIETITTDTGCLIIKDALAYLECTVAHRSKFGNCWLIYATVNQGQVLESEGFTAISHRNLGFRV